MDRENTRNKETGWVKTSKEKNFFFRRKWKFKCLASSNFSHQFSYCLLPSPSLSPLRLRRISFDVEYIGCAFFRVFTPFLSTPSIFLIARVTQSSIKLQRYISNYIITRSLFALLLSLLVSCVCVECSFASFLDSLYSHCFSKHFVCNVRARNSKEKSVLSLSLSVINFVFSTMCGARG